MENTNVLKTTVEALAEKAKVAPTPHEAMQLSQAALNLAHAAQILSEVK